MGNQTRQILGSSRLGRVLLHDYFSGSGADLYCGLYWGQFTGLVVCHPMFAVHARSAILLARRAREHVQSQDDSQQNNCTYMDYPG